MFYFLRKIQSFCMTALNVVILFCAAVVNFIASCLMWVLNSPRLCSVMMFLFVAGTMFAQNAAGDYSTGITALGTVSTEIAKYVPAAVKLCYAIAGVVAVVGSVSVFIKMNNEEQDVKKSIMMLVGACIFLIAAAQALPLFFGLSSSSN